MLNAVILFSSRPDTLDPALTRPGRLDRKIEFSLPDLEVHSLKLILYVLPYSKHGRVRDFQIHRSILLPVDFFKNSKGFWSVRRGTVGCKLN